MCYEMRNTETMSGNTHQRNCDCPEELTECLRDFKRTRSQINVVCGTANIKSV